MWCFFEISIKDSRYNNAVVLVSLWLTLKVFQTCFSVSIVNFEHVIVGQQIDSSLGLQVRSSNDLQPRHNHQGTKQSKLGHQFLKMLLH